MHLFMSLCLCKATGTQLLQEPTSPARRAAASRLQPSAECMQCLWSLKRVLCRLHTDGWALSGSAKVSDRSPSEERHSDLAASCQTALLPGLSSAPPCSCSAACFKHQIHSSHSQHQCVPAVHREPAPSAWPAQRRRAMKPYKSGKYACIHMARC